MKKIENLKRISSLLGLLLCVVLFTLACSEKKVLVKNENKTTATKSEVSKDLKEVKVSKPNEGGLKQELSTKAAVSTTDNKQLTFEVPASQLQGLKVGDALAINNGRDAYPATIVTIPQAQPSNQGSGSKVIVTAQVGPGINLPGNKRDYTVTYLYNNRDPRVHYINRNYVYYDDSKPYIYITGPDRVIRRKYIRVGLINRYYTEILDELDDAYRIVEDYINDYIDNYVIPNVVEDYTNQMIDQYEEYIDSLNKRWDYDDEVNTFTVNVDDVDWEKLEELDTVLTDSDITEIYEEVQTEKNNDESEIIAASADRDEDKNEITEENSYKEESNVEEINADDEDINTTTTTFNDAGNDSDESNDEAANENYSQNDEQQDYGSQDDVQDYNSNDDNSSYDDASSNDDYSSNDDNDSYSGGDDSSDEAYETTAEAFGDDED